MNPLVLRRLTYELLSSDGVLPGADVVAFGHVDDDQFGAGVTVQVLGVDVTSEFSSLKGAGTPNVDYDVAIGVGIVAYSDRSPTVCAQAAETVYGQLTSAVASLHTNAEWRSAGGLHRAVRVSSVESLDGGIRAVQKETGYVERLEVALIAPARDRNDT